MNALVTAGSGFIGTHLCKELLKRGHRVRVIDLQEPKITHASLEFVRADVCAPGVLSLRETDCVFHLAGLVGVSNNEKRPDAGYHTDVEGTASVVRAIQDEERKSGKKIRLVFTSTAAVYGAADLEGRPVSENTPLPAPLSHYAEHKQLAEKVILEAAATGLQACILRPFNVYGTGQTLASTYAGIVTIFAANILAGKPLLLFGGGVQIRDFVSVRDVALACCLAMEKRDLPSPLVLNLGTGIPTRVAELADLMMRIAGRKTQVSLLPRQERDVPNSLADIRSAKKFLGWLPETRLEDGLRELFQSLMSSS